MKKIFANKKLRIIFISSLSLVVIVSGLFLARKYVSSNKVVGVAPLDYYVNNWSMSETSGYGQITEGGVQNVFLNGTLIDKVYVEVGDQVHEGDPLLKYDTTENKLNIESLRIAYELRKVDLQNDENLLAAYQTYTPYVRIPYTTELKKDTLALNEDKADGSINKPYEYNVDLDKTVITEEFIGKIFNKEKPLCVKLHVYINQEGYQSLHAADVTIDPSKIVGDFNYYLSLLPIENDEIKKEKIAIFDIDDKNNLKSGSDKLHELPCLKSEIKLKKTNNITNNLEEIPEENSYSKKEIKKMIEEQEKKVASDRISVSEADLAYRKAKQTSEDGIVRADNDGIVAYVSDRTNLDSSEPYITVKSTSNYQIITTINEYMLANYHVGDSFQITMWSNGNTYNATITSISDFPSNNNFSYNYDSGASNYDVIAELDCEDELRTWDGGEVSFDNNSQDSSSLILEKCFIREENGRYYALVANDNMRIEKRYVEVGKILNGGYYIEVLDGLQLGDLIAFPYGKNAIEGAKADPNREVYSW